MAASVLRRTVNEDEDDGPGLPVSVKDGQHVQEALRRAAKSDRQS
jgi:hypothetical protein